MLTTPQAATRLGVTRGRVLQMITRGQLPAVKVGRDWLITEEDLQRVVDRPGPGRPKKER